MNCCNHDCNQGRTCPNRKQKTSDTPVMTVLAAVILVIASVMYLSFIFYK